VSVKGEGRLHRKLECLTSNPSSQRRRVVKEMEIKSLPWDLLLNAQPGKITSFSRISGKPSFLIKI